jgi:hypothetical protein
MAPAGVNIFGRFRESLCCSLLDSLSEEWLFAEERPGPGDAGPPFCEPTMLGRLSAIDARPSCLLLHSCMISHMESLILNLPMGKALAMTIESAVRRHNTSWPGQYPEGVMALLRSLCSQLPLLNLKS